mgnify:FL=1
MKNKKQVTIFEGQKIRRHWDDKIEKWFFSVVDVVEILTQSDRPRKYWNDLKIKLKAEGSELSEKIGQLELVLNMLAETFTTEISKKDEPKNFEENKKVARKGGAVAGVARKKLEKSIGRSVVQGEIF